MIEKHGINKSNLNEEVAPQKDFYEYACGGWIGRHPIPDEFSSYGQFDCLREQAKNQVRDLITNLANDPSAKVKGSLAQKISDLYSMGMDENKLNQEGHVPILPTLSLLKSNLKNNDFTDLIAWLHTGLDSSFFSSGVGPDPADSNRNIMHLGETGLGLGDRDYYLEHNENNSRIMAAYENYVKKIMKLTGYSDVEAERVWKAVIKIEIKLAQIKMTREERRNPMLHHNIFSIEQLYKEFDILDWDKYFKSLGIKDLKSVNVGSLVFFRGLPAILKEITPEEMEDYLSYSLISEASGLMSDDFIDANFEMFGKVMSGQKEKKPRWKRAMAIPDSMFGEAVGQLYVEKYFPKENKDYMLELVSNLRKSLDEHISSLEWMEEETKIKAREKLAVMGVKIGYPDKWKDYSGINIDPEKTYLENVQEASKWYTKDNYDKLNKPVDKEEWHMTPQTVNAYYSPVVNEICFPAAILQPPFFDIKADDSLNYGAIGVVIGHEMTHGFDDQGRQFDKDGNLTDWWLAQDAEKFNALADILVEQFNKVEIAPGVNANGRYTLGENIADQGGLNVALTAYKNLNNPEIEIDGFNNLQRFFLSYAGVWAGSIREEEKLVRTKTDPHSLAKNRVNVTLKNLNDFENAFSIKDGDEMYRPKKERVIIW
ncbi:MAG: M13 family metallopeptidase [Muribaculaceae bacterium]|nr:M13 family metallopeptidase [Muribaculaceae bacterium]